MLGLQLSSPTVSARSVTSNAREASPLWLRDAAMVEAAMVEAARDASVPAWPPPMMMVVYGVVGIVVRGVIGEGGDGGLGGNGKAESEVERRRVGRCER